MPKKHRQGKGGVIAGLDDEIFRMGGWDSNESYWIVLHRLAEYVTPFVADQGLMPVKSEHKVFGRIGIPHLYTV